MNTPTKHKAVPKLALSKNFKSALVTKLNLSDQETQEIVDSDMVDAANKDTYK